MLENLLFRITAGRTVYPWAIGLAEEWRMAGAAVAVLSEKIGGDRVRISAGLRRDPADAVSATFFLYQRQEECVGWYRPVRQAAQVLAAGGLVDFAKLADDSIASGDKFLDRLNATGRSGLKGDWEVLQKWLGAKSRVAHAIFACALADAVSLDRIGGPSLHERLIPLASKRQPHWLKRLEVRRLLLQAASLLFGWARFDLASTYLEEAAVILEDIGDAEDLSTRWMAMRGAARMDSGNVLSGFAWMKEALERADEALDVPTFCEVAADLAFLAGYRNDLNLAHQVAEAAAARVNVFRTFLPPKLAHRLTLFRALANPSPQTVAPLVAELQSRLELGDRFWHEWLDHFDRLKEVHGTARFLAVVGPLIGEANAANLSTITDYGRPEFADRKHREALRREEAAPFV